MVICGRKPVFSSDYRQNMTLSDHFYDNNVQSNIGNGFGIINDMILSGTHSI